ncbi:MAG: hypothetical protein ACOX6Y_00305 [Christensenellales bacterium]
MRKNKAKRLLIGFEMIVLLMMISSGVQAKDVFSCSLVTVDIASGYCGLRASLDIDNTSAVSVTFCVSASEGLTVYKVHKNLTASGGNYTLKSRAGVITYQFSPSISYNPVISVSDIAVTYQEGYTETLANRSFTVPIHNVHEHHFSFSSIKTSATCQQKGTEIWRCDCGAEEERQSVEYGPHQPDTDWTRIIPATCTMDGSRERECTICNNTVETETILAVGHNEEAAEWQTVDEPDCINKGLKVKNCPVCGERLESEELEATAVHQAKDEWETEEEATCEHPGLEVLKCRVCEQVMESRDIPRLEHEAADEWEVILGADCENEGREQLRCIHCKKVLKSQPVAALGHDYGAWITEPGLCTEARKSVRYCNRDGCSAQETMMTEAKDGHDLSDWQENPADCEHKGFKERHCLLCTYTEQQITEDVLGHSFITWLVETPASCENTGTSIACCVRAGCHETKRREDPALGHSFGYPPIYIKEQTCLQEGSYKQICRNEGCGKEQVTVLPQLPHFHGVAWSKVPCETGGISQRQCATCPLVETKEVAPGHVYEENGWLVMEEASCTRQGLKVRFCDVCQKEDKEPIETLPHDYGQPVLIKARKCGEADKGRCTCRHCPAYYDIIYDIKLHEYGKWGPVPGFNCTTGGEHMRICADCGGSEKKNVAPGEHTFGDWEVETPSTCKVAGKLVRTCEYCSLSEHKAADMPDHSYDKGIISLEATCKQAGEITFTCTVCGEVRKLGTAKADHRFGGWLTTGEATCEEDGGRLRACEDCGMEDKEVFPATGHVFETLEEQEATCEQAGKKVLRCTICKKVETVTLPALIHAYGQWEEDIGPACGKDGQEKKTCTLCGKEETRPVMRLHHIFNEWTEIKASSCSEEGLETSSCTLCGQEETRPKPKLTHTFSPWRQGKSENCEIQGRRVRICQGCGFEENQTSEPRKHVYGKWEISQGATCLEEGKRVRNCKHCPHQEKETLPLTGHRFGKWTEGELIDCSLPRFKHRNCEVCGMEESQEIAQNNHHFSAWEVLTPSTCCSIGRRQRACRRCGFVETGELPLKKHQYGPWENEPRENCEIPGTRHRSCLICNKQEMDVLKPRKHAYHRWQIIRIATCSQVGIRERTCKYCDYQEKQELAMKKHRAGKWTVSVPATLDKHGRQVKTCKNCGIVMQERSYHPGKAHFAVDFCVDGIRLKDVWPDVKNGAFTVAPVLLDQDSEHHLPLTADGRSQVGEVIIGVKKGELTVTYSLFGKRSEVLKERMQIFIPGSVITNKKLASNRQGRKLNQPISIQKSLKGADFALVFLRLDGIFYPDDVGIILLNEQLEHSSERLVMGQRYDALLTRIREEISFE